MDVSSLQDEWSPELLSELQRAVPVLESGSLEVAGGTWPAGGSFATAQTGGLRWSAWAHDARGLDEGTLVKPDILSDSAMALPMSTMTSGKRKVYPNRSTFQAHVCCVMDPEQVPRILDYLQKSAPFVSVRSWPYAYRIISPFDGQVHLDSDDGEDPGAGEKILGLLERMSLENLLLVVSHWNAGSTNRLGAELFRCVTEQCKDLLKELQEALRASFPPEELLRSEVDAQLEDADDPTPILDGTPSPSSDGDWMDPLLLGGTTSRHVDLSAIGSTPPAELMYASRGVCIQPTSRRTWPGPGRRGRGKPSHLESGGPPVVGTSCLPQANATASSAQECYGAGRAGLRVDSESHSTTFMTEGEHTLEGVDFNELSNEELEKLCQQLERDREGLEARLAAHQEVIEGFEVPLMKGTVRVPSECQAGELVAPRIGKSTRSSGVNG